VLAFLGSGYAGDCNGDLNVTGKIYAGTKDFRIDHPLDPANKYLVHASVESSEMMDIYTGNVTTDVNGEATVLLPEWFEALNRDFRYQLTVIGQFAMAIVAHEIENHQFQIRTNQSHVKVSWQVTGVRQDAFARAHPLVVEEEKQARLKGFYIHPELYGASDEKQIEWARHPQMMQRIKEHREAQQAAQQAKLTGQP
jgi:trimeric autotransporter adhesin